MGRQPATLMALPAHSVFRISMRPMSYSRRFGKESLYPVTQTSSATNEWGPILPYALTNPVFVDVDQNGTFDPPLGKELRLLQ
jgi:hypothetical protein